jgi:hypothetical protein
MQATGVMERAERANFVSKSDDKTPPDDMLALPLRLLREEPDFGDIAQLVERLVRNEKVRGSNPLISTKQPVHGGYFRFLTSHHTAARMTAPLIMYWREKCTPA